MMRLPFSDWHDFYLMIGTAAGVITGTIFVVADVAAGHCLRGDAGGGIVLSPGRTRIRSCRRIAGAASGDRNAQRLGHGEFHDHPQSGGVRDAQRAGGNSKALRSQLLSEPGTRRTWVAPCCSSAALRLSNSVSLEMRSFNENDPLRYRIQVVTPSPSAGSQTGLASMRDGAIGFAAGAWLAKRFVRPM